MTQHLPPIPPTKPKDRTMLAIVLAILLHLLMAIIIYFAVFADKPSTSEVSTKPSVAIPTVSEDPKPAPANSIVSNDIENTEQPSTMPAPSNSSNKTTVINKQIVSNNTTIQTQPLPSKESNNAEASVPTSHDNVPATKKPTPNDQNGQAEYTLKKTEEYEQLDDDIDADSEQLSKLITEVRKRNQTQIQQHQTDKKTTTSTDDIPMVDYDYPITPITSAPVPTTPSMNQNKSVDNIKPIEQSQTHTDDD
ncbi:hypothetical protein [Psychrobacter sp. AOP7-B1-24]|uniref:hypothetical protein n=1 Tax=Psychrobacter sp. AOP7-B1-24 TaxID=3457645 RepID=UPI00402BBF8B